MMMRKFLGSLCCCVVRLNACGRLEAAFARILGKHHKKKQLPTVDMPAKLKELNLFDHFPEEVFLFGCGFSGCAYMCVRRCGRPRHR